MSQKLVIDADPGIGDAFAIALATLDPSIDLIGVTATSGCVAGQVATQNILSLIESLDPPKRPRLGASAVSRPDFSVNGIVPLDFLDPLRLNGNYGLGMAEVPFAPLHNQRESAKLLVELVRNHPHEVTVLTLGPLTNLEMAIDLAPDFLDQVKQLVCLGGSVGAGGDVTAAAEFNIYADPVAARMVLRSAATRTLVPLDASSQVVLSFELFNRIKQTRPFATKWFFDDLLPFALRTQHEQLGLEGFPLHEVTALAAISEPRHFRTETLSIDVELESPLTRGVTVFDRRGRGRWQDGINVVTDVDRQGVLDYVQQVLRNPQC